MLMKDGICGVPARSMGRPAGGRQGELPNRDAPRLRADMQRWRMEKLASPTP